MASILNTGYIGTPLGKSIDTDSIITSTTLTVNTDLNTVTNSGVYGVPAITVGGAGSTPSLVESFTNAQTVSTDYVVVSATPTVTWNSSTQALSIVNSAATGGAVLYTRLGSVNATNMIAFEADFNFISDAQARKHFGFFIGTTTSAMTGYRMVNLDNVFNFSYFVNNTETSISSIGSTALTVGNVYTFRVVRSGAGIFTFYINGVQIGTQTTNTQFTGPFYPGFFAYGCTIEVNELRIYTNTLNYPTQSASILKNTANSVGTLQELTTLDTLVTYKRSKIGAGNFGSWKQI